MRCSSRARLCRWRNEVVAHPKRGRRPGLDKTVEDEEHRVTDTVVALEFERPSIDVPLQQHLEHENGVRLREHL